MGGGKRRASTDWRLAMSARTIVGGGVWSLLVVLIGTMTVGSGQGFLVLIALAVLAPLAIFLVACYRRSGFEH